MTALPEDPAGPDGVPAEGLCPFLRSRDGAWASSHASRELRCWAVSPGAQLAVAKQRALCLRSAHAGCATFVAASAQEPGMPAQHPDAAGIWPPTRTLPVTLEPVRGHGSLSVATPRSGGQAVLIGLMVIAFLALVVARMSAPDGSSRSPGAAASTSAAPAAVASGSGLVAGSPSAGPVPTAGAESAVPASPTPPPSARPSASPRTTPAPAASASVTYTVQPKDTLSGIAARYHTTVAALAAANGITNTRIIRVGQVLVIP
jgi:LysM repeat protein